MSKPEYYDVVFLMRNGEWGACCYKLALSTAKQYARDMVNPPEYSKRKPITKDRVKIRMHVPRPEGVRINPERDMYPKILADSKEQQREWDAEADRKCRPISEILDVVAEVLEALVPDEALPMNDKPVRPF